MISKILAGALLGLTLLGWFYYDSTSKKIDTLVTNNATLIANTELLKSVNSDNIQVMDELVKAQNLNKMNFEKLSDEFQLVRSQRDELVSKYEKHNLEYLATMKPELIEKIINSASANAGRCFELLTGAPLNEKEKKATSSNAFNSECPWLYGELK